MCRLAVKEIKPEPNRADTNEIGAASKIMKFSRKKKKKQPGRYGARAVP